MKPKDRTKCAIDSCENEAFYKKAGLCQTCYNGMYYWKNATPTQILHRHKQLHVLSDRMEVLSPNQRRSRNG